MANDLIANPFGAVAPRESAGARQSQSRELAEVQTSYLMAQQFPRDQGGCADLIIRAFDRLGLAESAEFQYKRGDEVIRGATIRAAEAMAQIWGNMDFGFREVARGVGADGKNFSEVEAFAVDLQSRTRRKIGFIVPHWRDTKSGGYALKNERDIYELVSNQAQRRVRACILNLIPGDVTAAAMAQAAKTMSVRIDSGPEATQKMLATFAEDYSVPRDAIEKLLQRKIDPQQGIESGQMARLKRLYVSIRDGYVTPFEAFDLSGGPSVDAKLEAAAKGETVTSTKPPPPPAQAPSPTPSATAALSYAQYAGKVKASADATVAEFVVDQAIDDGLPEKMVAELRTLIATQFKGIKK